ncbi:TenA family transcriptional regulator [Larsenimonas rhizosphaerae]|uniref:Iron-containing redox enzyme family protein n=1 Tax=Larsenimonas rhizosphaerae TaxID=2944682 RepID=A0AA41ZHL5_9GAMM|nr:iron-containing redox enzyme family protein [Larsenimonas rhizosphaerae]MCM2131977.1 iron-containing redox enzyme family protein [Larsenimonas rhizosphaerae]MCX2524725.1 iron-containing redox enzyme family protein [Larsenimonas rhizosphaerae]
MTALLFERLKEETAEDLNWLLAAPLIADCREGYITLERYTRYLSQAYQHVKHTVPLMMATGARLTDEQEWLREALCEYIEEEVGHQEWILNDLAVCGIDKDTVRHARPWPETEMMVSYAYDSVMRKNPVSFFGMVYVLESTSVSLATPLGEIIQSELALPKSAFSYLYSHGSLDLEHLDFFEKLVNRITDRKQQDDIIHMARMMYRLWGGMFYAVTANEPEARA